MYRGGYISNTTLARGMNCDFLSNFSMCSDKKDLLMKRISMLKSVVYHSEVPGLQTNKERLYFRY